MKKVLVFGTFDVIHPGHVSFLKQARACGDYLIASVARDRFANEVKGRNPVHSEAERLSYIVSSGLVDEAFISDEVTGTYSLVLTQSPDVVCFGHDQNALRENFTRWLDRQDQTIETVTLKPFKPHKFKSSKLNKDRA